jgi:hypothetical protein
MPHGSKNVKETIAMFDELFISRCECGHCHARKKAGLKCSNPNCILNRS